MELGTYRLAEINKGGGLRQKAVGLATQYLNGIGEWVAMPTAMTPTAHTHNYAGSDSAGGPATTATKLATARTISLTGSVTGSVSFDGSGDVSITTETNHTHSYLPLSGGTLTGSLGVGGTASSSERLLVTGSSTYGAVLRLTNAGTSGADVFFIASNSAWTFGSNKLGIGFGTPLSTNVKVVLDGSNGYVGIGKTNPGSILDVSGTVTASSFSGVGSSITSINASNLSSGTVPIARLPVGTGSTQVSAGDHTHSGYATSTHNHSIPDLYCGVPNIVPGRILISGSGGSSNPTWLDAGENGKILGWTSGAPAWVDAPSGSSVTAANPTASVGLTAVNGSATTFMRSDAAPKLDVSIAPTWTGNHTFSGLTQFANVGIGVSPSTAYKLYVVEDKEITTEGSYFGNCLIAKYNTTLTSGTRQGIALLGQLWAKGGTLSHAKGLDFKVYVSSGTVQEATAINAVIQTDGGSIETAYALKLSRSGTAPTVANYGVYQEDSAATNVFNGPCQFNGGTNLATGRVRNFLKLSAGETLTPSAGTDLLVFFERESATVQTLTFPATNMAGRAGDIIRVVLCGNCTLTFSAGSSSNPLIKPAYYGATANYYLTTQSTTGDWMFICDGTYWRSYMLTQLYS